MNPNTKILAVVAAVLFLIIVAWEFKERRAEAQSFDQDVQIQEMPQGPQIIGPQEPERIEIGQEPRQQPQQHRILRQPLLRRRPQPAPVYPEQYQQPQPQSGGCQPQGQPYGGGCQPYGGGGCQPYGGGGCQPYGGGGGCQPYGGGGGCQPYGGGGGCQPQCQPGCW